MDFNCDQDLRVVVIGDSLVSGIGDTENGDIGGYVVRAARAQRTITFTNLGVPGYHVTQLVADLTGKARSARSRKIWLAVADADVVVLDVGRNDRWDMGMPIDTYRGLRRAAVRIERVVQAERGVAPLVVTAVLMIPNRGAQAPWIAELNQIIAKNNRIARPTDLHFDTISKRLLSDDQIHPTSEGYDEMSRVFVRYLTKMLPRRMNRLRPDADRDGIYDLFETLKFGTDPTLLDTDGDGIADGQQIFGSF